MALIAYIRVSSIGQSLEVQRDKMIAAGVSAEHLFEEKRSGVDSNRPALKEAVRFARKGDVFLVTKIDRLARSTSDLLNIVNELQAKGVDLKVIDQSIDLTSPAGRAMLQMLAVFAEFETAIRKERQMDGIAKAKAEGKTGGRPKLVTEQIALRVAQLRREGVSIRKIATEVGFSKATIQKMIGAEAAGAAKPDLPLQQ